jgi:hypothetical protein
MPDINTINGLVLCDETNVNGVTIANITNIDGITKSCVTCTANGPILVSAVQDSCALACASEDCAEFYSNGSTGTCPLVNGDYLYTDTSCTLASNGYYSPKNCEGGCSKCYAVSSGVITVSDCPSPCNAIEFKYNSRSCRDACGEGECVRYYVNQTVECPLSVGTVIYSNSSCSSLATAGYYSPNGCDPDCRYCYTFSRGAITRADRC